MRKYLKNNKSGFTLVEALISLALTISVMSLTTSFLFRFNGYSNRAISQNTLDADLRIVQSRLEREITSGNKLLVSCPASTCSGYPGGGTIYSNNRRLIFSAPIRSTTNNDTIILEYQDEADYNDDLVISNAKTGRINRLKISVFPGATGSSRTKVIQRSLDGFINTTDDKNQNYNIFRYYTVINPTTANGAATPSPIPVDNTAVPPITDTNARITSIVVVDLWAKKSNNGMYVFANKSSQFRFMNK